MINLLNRSRSISLSPFKNVLFWVVNLENIEEDEAYEAKMLLSANALNRSERFNFQEDRKKSLITHAILRFHLGNLIKQAPNQIEITYNKFGKPFLKENNLHFNLSHTKHKAFLAVHQFGPIGIDIETNQKNLAFLETSDVFLPSEKAEAFNNSADPLDHLLKLWCAKEALLKKIGTGFLINELPVLHWQTSPFTGIDLFISMELSIYVYNQIIKDHKLAVCL